MNGLLRQLELVDIFQVMSHIIQIVTSHAKGTLDALDGSSANGTALQVIGAVKANTNVTAADQYSVDSVLEANFAFVLHACAGAGAAECPPTVAAVAVTSVIARETKWT